MGNPKITNFIEIVFSLAIVTICILCHSVRYGWIFIDRNSSDQSKGWMWSTLHKNYALFSIQKQEWRSYSRFSHKIPLPLCYRSLNWINFRRCFKCNIINMAQLCVRWIPTSWELYHLDQETQPPTWIDHTSAVSHLLITVSCSLNW